MLVKISNILIESGSTVPDQPGSKKKGTAFDLWKNAAKKLEAGIGSFMKGFKGQKGDKTAEDL